MWKWCGICCAVGLPSDRHYPLTQTSLSVAEDIHNWCQGPINQPVSKRPCNAFWFSAYVESGPVCQRAEPLRGRGGGVQRAGPSSNVDHMWAAARGATCFHPILGCLKMRGTLHWQLGFDKEGHVLKHRVKYHS